MNNNTTETIQLTHGQQIVVPSFKYTKKIELVTPRGYALQHGDCPEEGEARAIKFDHDLLGCFTHCTVISNDYEGKAEELEVARKEWEEAQRIEEGDIVECEGRLYKVKINGEQFCDSVAFIPVN
jgi:hypothetical protein